MDSEVAFVGGYALALLALAAGLHRLGRINNDPWSSRLFAAYRAQAPEPPPSPSRSDWPHGEAPRLYTAVAAVASTAALVLSLGELLRHHAGAEAMLLGAVAVAGSVSLGRYARGVRRSDD
jgi:hypothetical protein